MKNIQINCQKCGKPTLTGNHRGKYCKKCKHELWLNYRRRLKYKKRQLLKLTCQNCGKDLTDFGKSRKSCPDCRSLMGKKYSQENYQKNREKYLKYFKDYYQVPEHKIKHREAVKKSFKKSKCKK